MLNRPPESMLGDGKGFATQAELDERGVNVKQFGAVGDGSTDDSLAIQNAIDSLTNGGTVIFPVGTYLVSTALVGKIGVSLKGQGGNSGSQSPQLPNVTIKTSTLTSGNLLTFGASGDTGEGNLVVEGIRFAAEVDSKDAIFGISNYWKNVIIQNCSFVNFSEGVKTFAVQTWIQQNYSSSCGIAFDISATECHILNNHTFSESIEILLRDSGSICIGNKGFGDGSSGDVGIEVWGSQNVVIGNYMDAFLDKGIHVLGKTTAGANRNIIVGNTLYGIGDNTGISAAIYVDAQLGNAEHNIIKGNSISNERTDRTTIDGIRVNAATGYSANETIINGNTVLNVTGQKIRRSGAGTTNGFSIVGNPQYITENSGSISAVNGDLIAHGLVGTPKVVILTAGDNVTICGTDSYDSTNFRVLARNSDGTLVTTAKTFYFHAIM